MTYRSASFSVTQEEALSVQQIEARNVQEKLEGTKQKLNQLKAEISEDKNEDKNLEGVEGMIQRLITVSKILVYNLQSF